MVEILTRSDGRIVTVADVKAAGSKEESIQNVKYVRVFHHLFTASLIDSLLYFPR